jgi:hypothetical protein
LLALAIVGATGLTLVGMQIERDCLGHNLVGAIGDALGVLGGTVSIAFSNLPIINKIVFGLGITGWASGNGLTAGGEHRRVPHIRTSTLS